MKKRNLLGLNLDRLTALALEYGEPAFRGKQLLHQLYRKGQVRISEMTDLPSSFRDRLTGSWEIQLPTLAKQSVAADGTIKFLFQLDDGQPIESVYIPEPNRDTFCISSQVGCGVGCTFCLTAQMGLIRNLKAGEIVGQVLAALRMDCLKPKRYNIVFMGMGEPLHNYRNVMEAFRLFTDPSAMGISYRRITLSTSGVVPVLRRLQEERTALPNLAISLNATTNALRDPIMPINERWNLEELLETCRNFPLEPRRRITFEYVLLGSLNDSEADAGRLAGLLRGIPSKVNLIPFNPGPGLPFERPAPQRVERFREILVNRKVSAFVRRPRGDDISAACGQLAILEQVGSCVQ